VEIDDTQMVEFEVEGHDLLSLLYNLMDEFLFLFNADNFFTCKKVTILNLDLKNFRIRVMGEGERFDLTKHVPGTEIKAITYSNMQIHHQAPTHDVYVIVDI